MTQIISIHSYRGGTGKSNLTANLAATLAQQGNRVGVIDTDIQSPGIHILFGLGNQQIRHTLNDYLWGRCALTEAAHDVTASLTSGLTSGSANGGIDGTAGKIFLVPSSMRSEEIAVILSEGYDAELLLYGLKALCEDLRLDYLLIDTHPGLNEETLLSIGLSQALVVILRPDNQDYQGTSVVVEVARELEVTQMFLVINKVLPEVELGALRQKVEDTYQVPVVGLLPVSSDMLRLASQGLFCAHYPDHPITQEFRAIASCFDAPNCAAA
ncbi:MAG: MinD/ParA family protein [Elainellaceae cyanobacterium]